MFETSSSSSTSFSEDDFIPIRREKIYRERKNYFEIYDDIDFHERFRLLKPAVQHLLSLTEDEIQQLTGIGFETALHLASRGCRVIIADKESGLRSRNKIINLTNNPNIIVKYLDLSSLKSVRDFAKDINETEERLDILINNAGVVTVGNKHTEDGLHETMQINHFGPFLLTHLLVDLLKKSAPSRIIFVSSAFAFFSNLSIENLNYPKDHPTSLFRTALIYGNSKLCNVISANGFAERLADFGITCNSLHPGWVNTKMIQNSERWIGLDGLEQIILNPISYVYGKTTNEGAQTTLHLAMSNKIRDISGKYFWDCVTFPVPPGARNLKFCRDIWEETENFVKLSEKERLSTVAYKKISKLSEIEIKKDIEEFTTEETTEHNEKEEVLSGLDNNSNSMLESEDSIKIKSETDDTATGSIKLNDVEEIVENLNNSEVKSGKSKTGNGFLKIDKTKCSIAKELI